jgi:hypothetical protein
MNFLRLAVLGVFAIVVPAARSQAVPDVPPNRDIATYEIYSFLLQHPVLEDGRWPRKFWLIDADTHLGSFEDPRAIEPPPERAKEAQEMFADYKVHSGDTLHLDSARIQASVAVHLADAAKRKRFTASLRFGHQIDAAAAAEFDGIPSIDTFSPVFFNRSQTLAMVYVSEYCGGLCANARWVVLERKESGWKPLPWVHTFMIS